MAAWEIEVEEGRSPHGERGLKLLFQLEYGSRAGCRSPHGERGLKFGRSRSTKHRLRRSPHGERGLKSELGAAAGATTGRRSPHGERGLKFAYIHADARGNLSLPPRGAQIEMLSGATTVVTMRMLLPSTGIRSKYNMICDDKTPAQTSGCFWVLFVFGCHSDRGISL